MDISKYDEAVRILFSPNQNNASQLQEANDYLRENEYNPQTFQWAIEKLQSTTEKTIIKHAEILLTHWCSNAWEQIPADLINQLREALFLSKFMSNTDIDQSLLNIIGTSQVSFVLKMYPQYWPSFWSDFLEVSDNMVFTFLLALKDYTKALNLRDQLQYREFKNAMRHDGSDKLLADYIISRLHFYDKKCFEIYIYLISWINFNFIWTTESLEVINNTISNINTITYGIRCISALIERGMPDEEKTSLIHSLQIPERISAIIETDNEEIIIEIASLLRSISKSTNHPEIIQEFVNYALMIFEMNIYDSSLKILDFFEKYLKLNSENSVLIFELCYSKLALYFENDSVIDDILPIKISEIISKIKKLSPEINENFAKKISSSDTLQDTCACLLICSTVYKDNSCNEISISAILNFREVLDFSVPFEYDQQLSAVILYSSFLSYCANLFEGKTIFEFFEKLVYFSDYDVSSALINLSKNKSIHEFVTNDFIVTLASTRNESLLKCSAIFIEYIKDGQDDVLGTIIGLLQGFLMEDFENLFDNAKKVLLFIKSVNSESIEGYSDYVYPLLIEYQQCFSQDDIIFSEYIETLSIAIGNSSLEILLSLIDSINGVYSLISILNSLKRCFSKENSEWVISVFDNLMDSVIEEFSQEKDWNCENEEKTISINLLTSFLTFSSTVFEIIGYNERLFIFISNTFVDRCDQPIILSCLCDFCSVVASNDPKLASGFMIPSISFLLFSGFDPVLNLWKNVVRAAAEFHRILVTNDESLTVVNSFQELGFDENFAKNYIEIFKLPRQMHGKQAIKLFADMKHSINT